MAKKLKLRYPKSSYPDWRIVMDEFARQGLDPSRWWLHATKKWWVFILKR